MKRVMIVDDEMLVRTGIKSLIDWENQGYQLVCDAGDGEEAKKKIEIFHPDIILTDLMMTPVDGFELIEYCRKTYPQIKLVVLSNYNDFENVRRAMKLGASDYLFKLMIKPDELLKVLEEAGRDINVSKEAEFSEVLQKNLDSIKSGILRQLEEKNPGLPFTVKELFAEVPLKVALEQEFRVLRLWADNLGIIRKKENYTKMDLVFFTIQNMTEEILNRTFQAEVFQGREGEFVVLFNVPDREKDTWENIDETCMLLADYIYRFSGISVSLALSGQMNGYEMLREGLMETQEIRDTSLLRKREHVLGRVQLPFTDISEEFSQDRMKVLIEQGNVREVLRQWKQFFFYLSHNRSINPKQVKSNLRKFCRPMEYLCQRHQIETDTVVDKNGINLEEAIREYDRFEDMEVSIGELMEEYEKIYSGIRQGKCRKEVVEAKRYIKDHLQDSITAESVATCVNMSQSRFSHIFKEDTGMTLIEYVIEKRMNMAARLLEETEWKIGEISSAVGIDNPNYFSTQFRKKFHVSPLEYRKR